MENLQNQHYLTYPPNPLKPNFASVFYMFTYHNVSNGHSPRQDSAMFIVDIKQQELAYDKGLVACENSGT